MDTASYELYDQLKQGPVFLFLGQDYLRLTDGVDPFLQEVLKKYAPDSNEQSRYTEILDLGLDASHNTALPWMYNRGMRLDIPEWLKVLSEFTWNGVYTSAIDELWLRALRATKWRQTELIFSDRFQPIDIRSSANLHCHCLFGNVNQSEEGRRPPLNPFELGDRRQTALAILRRLTEVITPFGTMLIEGYGGDDDWLTPMDLIPNFTKLNHDQVHIFSVTTRLEQNRWIQHAVQQRRIVLHHERLAEFLLRGKYAGLVQLGVPDEEREGKRITIRSKRAGSETPEKVRATIPTSLWVQVTRSVTILDDSIVAPVPPLNDDQLYEEFRRFLSSSGVRPVWAGYAYNFAFRRGFEKKLFEVVEQRLQLPVLNEDPIVLHGPTGTGKTIALGRLAYETLKESGYPVLFIERKSQKPIIGDIEAFCKWAEDNGAQYVLIVWDGTLRSDEEYHDLSRRLAARGRKVLVVGSCYRIGQRLQTARLVEAEPQLEGEFELLERFLNRFRIRINQKVKRNDPTFLAALWRLLPSSRMNINEGVLAEIGTAEQEIRSRVRAGDLTEAFASNLGYALWKANLVDEESLFSTDEEVDGEYISGFEELVGLIMVPGSLGIRVPLEVLLRTLASNTILNFVDIVKDEDLNIFTWHTDHVGNVSLGPRQTLEAQLFVRARFGSAKVEMDFARRLLLNIRDNHQKENAEVRFAVDLVRSMGPNAPKKTVDYYAPYFLELSNALSDLREKFGVYNARLMLQEAGLIREWVVWKSKRGKTVENVIEHLDRAEHILHLASDTLNSESGNFNRKLRSQINVELSSTIGTRMHHIAKSSTTFEPTEMAELFQTTCQLVFQSRALDSENYYAIDVLVWVSKNLLKLEVLDEKTRAEAEANLLHIFATANVEDFSIVQQENFLQRRMQMTEMLGKVDLSEEAFQELCHKGSAAGYFLRAMRLVENLSLDQPLSDQEKQRCTQAAKYLDHHYDAIRHDGRSLYLLFKLFWMSLTGLPLFSDQRQTVAFTFQQWEYCVRVLRDLQVAENAISMPSLQYLYGLALFHMNNYEEAFQIFEELKSESEYIHGSRRIVRSYVASQENGRPQVYNGSIAWVDREGHKADMYVEELRRRVIVFPSDFGRDAVTVGETLGPFHIAFNFISPVVDTPGAWRSPTRK